MRIVYLATAREDAEFAAKAVAHFASDPRTFIYTEDDPAPGVLVGIRWNPFAVLVLRRRAAA